MAVPRMSNFKVSFPSNAPASWPLLLKLMHFHSHELSSLTEVLRLTEITLFKLKFMKGKSSNNLPKYLAI